MAMNDGKYQEPVGKHLEMAEKLPRNNENTEKWQENYF